MSEASQYFDLITHDLKLFDLLTGKMPNHLAKEDFSDWQVTVLFYMACIYLKAACSFLGIDIQDHFTLRQVINNRKEFYSIARDYRHLEEASRDARYEGRRFEKPYIADRLIPKFTSVRDCMVDFLKQNNISDIPSIEVESLLSRH